MNFFTIKRDLKMKFKILSLAIVFAASFSWAQQPFTPVKKIRKGVNLLQNGNFRDIADPFRLWVTNFPRNSFYANNWKYLAIVDDPDGQRGKVLRMDGTDPVVLVNWGVKIYTQPIRYDPAKKYKISLWAKSIGTKYKTNPFCRVYPVGYGWKPRAKKSNNPDYYDLRELCRFQPIYFVPSQKTGPVCWLRKTWSYGERIIPTEGRSQMQESYRENCKWLLLHINFLDATMGSDQRKLGKGKIDFCSPGYMYVSDVRIEECGFVDKVKIDAGSQTKGFGHGKRWNEESKQLKNRRLTPLGKAKPSKSKSSNKK